MSSSSSASSPLVPCTFRTVTASAAPTGVPSSSHAHSRAAVKRCCAAWKRAYNASMNDSGGEMFANMSALGEASEAYCNAMPMLDSHQGIRDFIACTAHGILIDAIPLERSGRLLYAAQVALSFLQQESRSTSAHRSRASKPRAKKSSAKKPRE